MLSFFVPLAIFIKIFLNAKMMKIFIANELNALGHSPDILSQDQMSFLSKTFIKIYRYGLLNTIYSV
ncbi:MAG: hypothetical protein COU81_00225 [Candidatus Portnoybacteria bacterium CG10_big_fil_rev_8_21_14_0_10_36_7]|uniref:Uncharacterized protein n=1 Tax=Candidatus Portnoybacteria bacterium CG10_big_fil_rev_8_21_14_0_10_36_7 TaxID=1974812 RepID=A0A2M8KF20_9BACT|nr:MAG: hypothetical protein COU81_00225 [Candidatus Portnoybacteria bacterium CG10_big_fil_rev_8_21_14_0_10_36_7]